MLNTPVPEKNLLDTADFIELLLKHLIHSKDVMVKTKELGLTGDDFVLSEYSVPLYKIFAEIALEIGEAPISQELFGVHLRTRMESGAVQQAFTDQAVDLYVGLYNDLNLNPEYFNNELKNFIKRRRQEKAKLIYAEDTDKLTEELNKIAVEIRKDEIATKATVVNPFERIIKKPIYQLNGTGLRRIDEIIGGLAYGEFGLIIGFSGGGKTALSTYMAFLNARAGKKVAYFSIEESHEDLSNRFYAQFFRVPYETLRTGTGYTELDEKFAEMHGSEEMIILSRNLKLFGLKGMNPLKPAQIGDLLDEEFEKTGFYPDVVYIDQLQFLEPDNTLKGEQTWESEKRTVSDLDVLSNRLIGGHPFTLWVNHQAKGKLKKYFSNEDLSGFKGIIHKPETVLGIGRAQPTDTEFGIFSIKSRHSKNFTLDYNGDLEFMSFADPVGADPNQTYAKPKSVVEQQQQAVVTQLDMVKQLLTNAPATANTGSIPKPSLPTGS